MQQPRKGQPNKGLGSTVVPNEADWEPVGSPTGHQVDSGGGSGAKGFGFSSRGGMLGGAKQGGSFCHLLWTIDRPPREGFLFEGVGKFSQRSQTAPSRVKELRNQRTPSCQASSGAMSGFFEEKWR